jgi:hypothetical protein
LVHIGVRSICAGIAALAIGVALDSVGRHVASAASVGLRTESALFSVFETVRVKSSRFVNFVYSLQARLLALPVATREEDDRCHCPEGPTCHPLETCDACLCVGGASLGCFDLSDQFLIAREGLLPLLVLAPMTAR